MKAMSLSGYHHNGFLATHALGHIMYGYTLLIPMNQRVLNKQSKEHNISGHSISGHNKSGIKPLKTAMCNCTSCAQVHKLPQSHCDDNWESTLFS